MIWHQEKISETIEHLKSAAEGLTAFEARKRLAQYGENVLIEKERKSPFMLFVDQFRDFMILVLMVAALISGFIGEPADTIAILVIVILNAVVGFVQEYRAEKAMAALKNMAAPSAAVLRDGVPTQSPASDLVPGDVVLLEAGNVAPADMRIMESVHMRIQEAALTGESFAVEKHSRALPQEDLPLGDRKNMAYKGTTVAYGRGRGIVVGTGMHTELGKIARLLQQEEDDGTPLQKRLSRFGKRLAVAVLFICAFIFGVGLLRSEPPLLMLLTAISLAVAAIPEALPAVVTISLALGARKMVAQNVLVRKLSAVETLGSVTYICSDKTGTLTLNQMAVERLYADGKWMDVKSGEPEIFEAGKSLALLMKGMALNNDCYQNADGGLAGDPTEIALYRIAMEMGFDKRDLEKKTPRIAEIPFDSERKCMTTLHAVGEGSETDYTHLSFTKGAVETLVDCSNHILSSGGILPMDGSRILEAAERMTAEGMRVLGIAFRKWTSMPEEISSKMLESGLTFLGLIGMMDPPRKEAADAVATCRRAGIRPVMITGDHPLTAETIARRLGILDEQAGGIMTGVDLQNTLPDAFAQQVENIRVYARVAPEQKLNIVNALQARGQFVAMTGDGVNDAPALKSADIGIAMGITGTEVSKEAAHMILLDDNFATIVKAVGEGRRIYDNIRKFIKYLLTTNSGEIWALFVAPLLGLPIPLLPIHILWMNLVTDGLPALALSAEPAEDDVMKRPPRPPKESIFAHGLGFHALWVGILIAVLALGAEYWTLKTGAHWRTMVFTVLCLTQLGHAMAIRSEKASLFQIGIFSNKYLLGAVMLTFALQMAVVYVPFLNPIFKTVPLSGFELMLSIGISCVVFVAVEIEKLIRRSKSPKS